MILAGIVAVVVVAAYLLVTLVPIPHRLPVRYEIITQEYGPDWTGFGPNFTTPRNGMFDFSWQTNGSNRVTIALDDSFMGTGGTVYSDSKSGTNATGSVPLYVGYVYEFTVGAGGPVTVNITGIIDYNAPLLT
jgi:hypothetical protein